MDENPDVDAKVLNAGWDAGVLKDVDGDVVVDAGMEVEEEEEVLAEAFSVAVGLFLLWVDNRLSFLADFSIGMDGLWRDIGLRVEAHLDAVVAEGCLDSSLVNNGVVDGVVDVTSTGGDSSFLVDEIWDASIEDFLTEKFGVGVGVARQLT